MIPSVIHCAVRTRSGVYENLMGKTICNYQNNNEIYGDYVHLEKNIDVEYLIHNISLVYKRMNDL